MPPKEMSDISHEEDVIDPLVLREIDARPDEPVAPNFFDQDGNDWLLSYAVYAAEAYGWKQSVTLYVNGTIICGTMIRASEFFDLYLKKIMRGAEIKKGTVPEEIKMLGETVYGGRSEDIKFEEFKPRYIHLQDVRVFSGTTQIHLGGMPSRVRLSEVAGFNPGTVEAAEE